MQRNKLMLNPRKVMLSPISIVVIDQPVVYHQFAYKLLPSNSPKSYSRKKSIEDT